MRWIRIGSSIYKAFLRTSSGWAPVWIIITVIWCIWGAHFTNNTNYLYFCHFAYAAAAPAPQCIRGVNIVMCVTPAQCGFIKFSCALHLAFMSIYILRAYCHPLCVSVLTVLCYLLRVLVLFLNKTNLHLFLSWSFEFFKNGQDLNQVIDWHGQYFLYDEDTVNLAPTAPSVIAPNEDQERHHIHCPTKYYAAHWYRTRWHEYCHMMPSVED